MQVKTVWQFFEAERAGNAIHLFSPGADSPLHTFRFGRQPREDGLCLSDYILDPEPGGRDHLALYVVTAGSGIRERAEQAKASGEFFRMHALQALAIETAEGCAEWLHLLTTLNDTLSGTERSLARRLPMSMKSWRMRS